MRRRFGPSISRLLILALLFTQVAVAAYACPKWLNGSGSVAAASISTDAACDQMDSSPSPLCFEHCFHRDQGASHGEASGVPLAVLPARFVTLVDVASLHDSGFSPRVENITHAPPPPHTVLHCCFRI